MALDMRGRMKMGLRLAALAPAFAIGLPAQWLALKLGSPLTRHIPVIFHRYLCFVMAVKVIREGHEPQAHLHPAAHIQRHVRPPPFGQDC